VLNHTILAVAFTVAATTAAASEGTLTCEGAQQESKIEKSLMGQAPGGAKRVGPHVLEISVAGKVQRFIDKPPYRDLEGTRWFYCGYDARSRVHLLGKSVDELSTGVILFESNGRRRQAGHTVHLAAAGKRFLAVEQPNGLDGEMWTLYANTGQKLWTGYAGFLERPAGAQFDIVRAELVSPYWNSDASLSAHVLCSGSDTAKGKVTLQATPGGMAWLPVPAC
jgi:hypothetical protein